MEAWEVALAAACAALLVGAWLYGDWRKARRAEATEEAFPPRIAEVLLRLLIAFVLLLGLFFIYE